MLKSNGRSQRSYLYAADLMIWLWTILFKGEACRPYNVGSEEALTIKKLAEEVTQELELEQPIQVGQGGLITSYVPDTSRARKELFLRSHFSIRESIRKQFEWELLNQ